MILMLFHFFCMFYIYWRIKHRSQNSAGKRSVKIPYLRRSASPENNQKVPILPEDGGSQKGSRRRATMGPHHAQARAHPWPRLAMVRRPCVTSLIFVKYKNHKNLKLFISCYENQQKLTEIKNNNVL